MMQIYRKLFLGRLSLLPAVNMPLDKNQFPIKFSRNDMGPENLSSCKMLEVLKSSCQIETQVVGT